MGKKKKNYRNKIIGIILLLFVAALILGTFTVGKMKPKAAVIPVKGQISFGSLQASPKYVEEKIDKAKNRMDVKGVIFEINSPGGSPVASKKVAEKIKNLEKPNVCVIDDIGTSGAYWVASACDKIVADSLSVTGSIGVDASYLEFSGFMKKYGIEYEKLTKGKYKDTGSAYRNLTKKEKEMMMELLDKIYEEFISSIAENRDMTYKKVKELADGSIYLGSEAKEKGLIDVLGGMDEAKNILEERTNKKLEFSYYENSRSIINLLNVNKNSPLKNKLNPSERLGIKS